jgi:Fe-S-cluster containining protein
VIFADVKLRRGDNAARLKALGLPVTFRPQQSVSGAARRAPLLFAQPCVAHDGCRCCIYAERPVYCRDFECALLKKVKRGKVTPAAPHRTVAQARKRAEDVKTLLRKLGDTDERLALSKRFRRTSSRFEDVGLDEPTAGIYGRLTLAVHDLNFLLHEEFYPPPG